VKAIPRNAVVPMWNRTPANKTGARNERIMPSGAVSSKASTSPESHAQSQGTLASASATGPPMVSRWYCRVDPSAHASPLARSFARPARK
jgi:hypothetical protein